MKLITVEVEIDDKVITILCGECKSTLEHLVIFTKSNRKSCYLCGATIDPKELEILKLTGQTMPERTLVEYYM